MIPLQAIPTLFTLSVWTFFELRPRLRKFTPSFKRASLAVGLIGLVANAFVVNRSFSLLECDSVLKGEGWSIGATLLSVFVGGAMLLGTRYARLGVLSSLLLASGAVAADWMLRGGLATSRAAAYMAAVQNLWCLSAVVLLAFVERSVLPVALKIPPSFASSVVSVDTLHRHDCEEARKGEQTGKWWW